MPISDEQKWIDMNNSLLQDKAPFPNTSIIQTPYHAWKRIWIHDFKTFSKHQDQIVEWFEKGFLLEFSILNSDIRILESLQPNYPLWP